MWRKGFCRGVLLVTVAPGTVLGFPFTRGVDVEGLAESAASTPARIGASPARVPCPTPRTLRLRRFEDRSAQLLCGHRVIVRVSVPW